MSKTKQEIINDYWDSLAEMEFKQPWYEDIIDFFKYDIPFAWREFKYEYKKSKDLLTRGYSDDMVWGYADKMADLNLKLLKEFQKNKIGHPASMTQKQWDKILNEMIKGFEAKIAQRDLWYTGSDYKKEHAKLEKIWIKGMGHYTVHYDNLWD